ncbi:MAG: helix-turn-helix transcriptional regulator [Chthoniobacterales bacterium]
MSPARTQQLIAEVQAWCKTHQIKKKELAAMLGMTPQALNDVLSGRNQPTGERALHMQELLKTKPKRKP